MKEKELFNLVFQMGETMLREGGEIFRINETMERAAKTFGLRDFHAYVIANGIFASAVVDGAIHSCQVRAVPLSPITLSRVEAVNSLSRGIVSGQYTPEAARDELRRIRCAKGYSKPLQILGAGVGSGTFCYLFGGQLPDCLLAFSAGVLIYTVLLCVVSRTTLPKIMTTILCSAMVTLYCCITFEWGMGVNLDKMVIGAIFPMVPGVPLTNGVRNFLENDHLSGIIRLVDALLTASCIAVGVGTVMNLWSSLVGGVVL